MKCVKAVVAASFVLSLASTALAQSPAGAWELTVDTPQGANTSTLNLKQDGDKLTGDLTSQMGSTPITGTFSAGTVAVTANIDIQGTSLQLGINGTVDADTMTGEVKFGDFGAFPFTAKRAGTGAAAAAPAPPAAPAARAAVAGSPTDATGKWDILLNIEGVGEFPVQADFKQDGTKLTGTFSGPAGDVTLQGTMMGSSLKMEFEVETPQGKMPIVMTGELGAEGFTGKATLAGMGEANWKGTRAKEGSKGSTDSIRDESVVHLATVDFQHIHAFVLATPSSYAAGCSRSPVHRFRSFAAPRR